MIQIPCLNEEETLPATLRDIPSQIDGIDEIEVVIIDDGCTDRTVAIARELGVEHVIRFAQNRGLGHAFSAGIDYCLCHGADIIVNTDGDNQYYGGDIATLVQPILEGRAELVIGDREPASIPHFSPLKKGLQSLGSQMVSWLAGLKVGDVASGFKAYTREAASRMTLSTDFDHTVDHVIQAGRKHIPTVTVPIRTNDKLRESRLFSNVGVFISRSISIMVRVYSSYGAMKVFSLLGLTAFGIGVAVGLRFLYFLMFTDHGELHVQSLILAAVLMLTGVQMILTGIAADLINSSRAVMEDVSYRLRRMEAAQDAGRRASESGASEDEPGAS